MSEARSEICIMTQGVATLHADYLHFFPQFGRLVGKRQAYEAGRIGLASACSTEPGFWHRGFFFHINRADHCDTMNY